MAPKTITSTHQLQGKFLQQLLDLQCEVIVWGIAHNKNK